MRARSMRIKRLIAREGLIVLGIITSSILLIFASSQVNRRLRVLPLDNWTTAPEDESEAISKIRELRSRYPEYDDQTNLELSERMARKYPEWQGVHQVMQRINEESIRKKHKYNYALSRPRKITRQEFSERLSVLGFQVLYFGYPIYLLVRFVVWAIAVLRQAATGHVGYESSKGR